MIAMDRASITLKLGTLSLIVVSLVSACDLLSVGPNPPGLVRKLSGHSLSVSSISWSPDGKLIASGSVDGTVRIWNANDGHIVTTLTGFQGNVVSVAWSPDGKYLATGSAEPQDTVKVWDTANWKAVHAWDPSPSYLIDDIAWSPDGKSLAIGVGDLIVLDAATGKTIAQLIPDGGVHSVRWSPTGKLLAYGSTLDPRRGDNGLIVVWEPFTHEQLDPNKNPIKLTGQAGIITSVAWSPDGSKLATGSDENTVKVWDTSTKQNLFTFTAHSHGVMSIAWSPDGRYLATGSWGDTADDTAKVWDATNGQNITKLEAADYVNAVSWSPDGQLLATADHSGNVWLWKIK